MNDMIVGFKNIFSVFAKSHFFDKVMFFAILMPLGLSMFFDIFFIRFCFLGGAFIAAFFLLRREKDGAILKHKLALLVLAYIGYAGLSIFWTREAEAQPEITKYAVFQTVVFLGVIISLARRSALFALLMRVMLACGVAALGWGLRMYIHLDACPNRFTASGVFYQVVPAVSMIGVLLLMNLDLLWKAPVDSFSRMGHWIFISIISFLAFVTVLTQSRGPVAGIGVAALMYLGLCKGVSLTDKVKIAVLPLLAVGAAWAFLLLCNADTSGVETAQRLGNALTRDTLSTRWYTWVEGIRMLGDRYWFGFGYLANVHYDAGEWGDYRHAHSIFLSQYLFGGIVGLVFFLGLMGAALKQAWGVLRQHEYPAPFFALIFGLICGLTDFAWLVNVFTPEWLLIWLPIGAAIGRSLSVETEKKA